VGGKQIGGPMATAAIALIVLLAIGIGYFYMNKDHMGKGAEAVKYNKPGQMPAGADPKVGPFPSDTLPNGQKSPGGYQAPGVPKQGATGAG